MPSLDTYTPDELFIETAVSDAFRAVQNKQAGVPLSPLAPSAGRGVPAEAPQQTQENRNA